MSGHTPGPWLIDPKSKDCIFFSRSDKVRGIIGHTLLKVEHLADGEWEANARLIAAAPDLLEALQLLQGFGWSADDSDHGREIKRRCDVAVSKAKG